MRSSRPLTVCCALAVLSGCVTLQPTVVRDAKPTQGSGYLAGIFSSNKGFGFGLGLVNADTGADHVMPFGESTALPSSREGQVAMIELPPGNYRIGYWVTYATLTHQRSTKADIPAGHPLGRPFALAPGQVVILGSLEAETLLAYPKFHLTIHPRRISEQSAVAAFRESYPGFQGAPVTCLLCVEKRPPWAGVPAKLPPASPVPASAGAPPATPSPSAICAR